ncbi:hypothetical protein NC651_002277 [Populus alba x Populus x berolinensis]|nr:hypothetical protein NC651_002277 [Populus alba x Populus x berolinensis]
MPEPQYMRGVNCGMISLSYKLQGRNHSSLLGTSMKLCINMKGIVGF